MQYAALLSDLNTLSICPPQAALNLVSAHKTTREQPGEQPVGSDIDTVTDTDLQRPNELVSLHYDVKVKYVQTGLDPELTLARYNVQQVLAELAADR